MEVSKKGGPIRAKNCDECNADFSFTNDDIAVAESVDFGG